MRLLFLAVAALPLAVLGEPAAQPQIPAPDVDGVYLKLGFDRLSAYKFVAPDYDPLANPKARPPTGEEQIPAIVKSWNGRKAVVTGFMLPTKLDNGKAVEFLLMANQMACCYGTVPNMNDWIIVRSPKGVPVTQDVPISFRGTFTVSAAFESGYMTGIYELDAEGPGVVSD
ncbi:MAG TPA: DUF3299 domain-containing protein [Opitutaceae bacterium]|nr:DUF3299 domain-containing protein [Opitutaceae bacterium]